MLLLLVAVLGNKVGITPIGGDTSSGAPSVLVAYGEEDSERLKISSLPGTFVPLTSYPC